MLTPWLVTIRISRVFVSANMIQIWSVPVRLDWKAIWRPSGAHVGKRAAQAAPV